MAGFFPKLTKAQYHARSKKAWVTRKRQNHPVRQRVDGTFKVSKRGKYNANGRYDDGNWFPSKAEADRYAQLREMSELGMIAELELQPAFPCRVNGHLVCTYKADFRYRARPRRMGSRIIIEDVKGMRTREYVIKRKLVEALYPIEIMEIKVSKKAGVAHCRMLTADQIGKAPDAEEKWPTGFSIGLLRSSKGSQS